MKRFGSILLTLVMLFTLCAPASALTTSGAATTLRLEKATGTVTTKNAGGTVLTTRDGMRLANGYELSTDKASYAHISLDSTKVVKLDASSVGAVHQSGTKLELQLSAGSLFFDVSAPLKTNEDMTIRTSTMVTGVRGTCGWVTVLDVYTSRITLLEGELLVTSTDPVTGLERTTRLVGGQTLTATYEGIGHGFDPALIGDHVTIQDLTEQDVIHEEHILYTDVGLTVEELQEEDVPGFVAVEVAKSPDLQQRIEETTELVVEEIIGLEDFLEKSDPALAEKLQAVIAANPDAGIADITEQLATLGTGDIQELFAQAAEEQVAAAETAAEEQDAVIQEAYEALGAEDTEPLFEEEYEEEDDSYESSGGSSTPAPVPPAVTYTLTTNWQDDQGNELEASTTETLNEGDSYTAEEKTFTGYQLKETTGDAVSGTMDSDKTVTFVYEKLTEITLDDPTTQELIDALDFGYNIINITNANDTQVLDLGAAVAGSAAQAITADPQQTVNVQSGTVSTATGDTVTVDGTLNITGDTTMDNAGTLVGNGTLNVSDTATLNNTGRIEINSTQSLHINDSAVLDNSGTIIIGNTAAGAMTVDGEVYNSGTIIVGNTAGSSMTVAGTLDGTGSVSIAEGSTLEVEDTGYLGSAADGVNDFFEIYGSADFSGLISNGGFLAVQDGGSLTLSGTMDNDALGIDTATISVFGTFTTEEGSTLNNFGTISVSTADGGTTTGTLELGGDTYNYDTINARNGDTFDAGVIRNSGVFENDGTVNTDTMLENDGEFINYSAAFSPLASNLQNLSTDSLAYVDNATRTELYVMVTDPTGLVTAWGVAPESQGDADPSSPFYYEDSEGTGFEDWQSGYTYTLYGAQATDAGGDFVPVALPKVTATDVTLDLNGIRVDLRGNSISILAAADAKLGGELTIMDCLGGGRLSSQEAFQLIDIRAGSLTLSGVELISATTATADDTPSAVYAEYSEDSAGNIYPITIDIADQSNVQCQDGYAIYADYLVDSSITVTGSTVTGSETGISITGYETSLTLNDGSTVTGTNLYGIDARDISIIIDGGSTVTGNDRGLRFESFFNFDDADKPSDLGITINDGTVTVVDDETYGYQYGIDYLYAAATPGGHVTIGTEVYDMDSVYTIVLYPGEADEKTYYQYDSKNPENLDDPNDVAPEDIETTIVSGNATVSGDGALYFGRLPS